MHFPLRGEAIVRTRELRDLVQATPVQTSMSVCRSRRGTQAG
jgi:hypothetical protein